MSDLAELTALQLGFRDARNWKQFHTLKNLIVSLNLEAAELLELAQWQTDAEFEANKSRPEVQQNLADECADVLLYLVLVADAAGIDLMQVAKNKVIKNALKYPAPQA